MTKSKSEQRSTTDELRYQDLKKQAVADTLAFRETARQATAQFTRQMRRSTERANSRNAPIYSLFNDWTNELAPELEALEGKAESKALRQALARQLNLTATVAEERAKHLVDQRREELLERFIDLYQYGASERKYQAARDLFAQPIKVVADIRDRFVDYVLCQTVANELGLAIFDPHSSFLKRGQLARKERHQIKRYFRKQSKRLAEIRSQQEKLIFEQDGIVGRIFTLKLDTILAFDAYRQYKKRLDTLKPTSRTPAKTMSLFATVTKSIRDAYVKTLPADSTLLDTQLAIEELDNVLIKIFAMTDTERNALMVRLKQYRELDREAERIHTEQTAYPLES